MNITIKDIARMANVSMTTVSNVMNNKSNKVSQETIEKINRIIKEYNYSPNMNAKALVNSSSKLIGLLFHTEAEIYNFNDPFAGELLEGIEMITRKENYFVLLQTINSVEDIGIIRNNWQFSGFIGVGFKPKIMDEAMKIIKEPICFIDTYYDEQEFPSILSNDNLYLVHSDDKKIAENLVQHLIEKGHSKIAFLTYRVDLNGFGVIQERYSGYLKGLKNNGILPDSNLVFYNDDLDHLISCIDSFTAVVTTADILGIQLISKLKEASYSVPKDCSVVSFDNIQFSELVSPKLTTMNLFQKEKGKIAFNQILPAIKGLGNQKSEKIIVMDSHLEVRESVIKLEVTNGN